jgi:hypothetical protein
MRGQSGFGGHGIRVRVALEKRSGQKSAIYQRRMTQPVQQNCFAAPSQGGDYAKIRHVTSGKQQRSFASRERGKLFLETTVFNTVSRNQMRSPAAGTAASGALHHGGGNSGMPRKAQVIVTGKVDELSPIDKRSYATPGLGESFNRSPRTTKMLTIELCEGGTQLRRPALH